MISAAGLNYCTWPAVTLA